jgi:predicted Zn finger-like uncharacterized protein
MEVRCGHCNKLFRVSDDKITGAGIKFKCTKCGEYVKITMEDFQAYKLSSETVSVLDTVAPKPAKAPAAAVPSTPQPLQEPAETGTGFGGFDIVEEHEAVETAAPKKEEAPFLAAPHEFGEEALAGAPSQVAPPVQPAAKPEAKPKPEPKVMPSAPKAEPAPSSQGPTPAGPSVKSAPAAKSAAPPTQIPQVVTAQTPVSSGVGKKALIVIVVLLIAGALALSAVKWFTRTSAEKSADTGNQLISPDGLQVTSSLATWDPANSDLVLNVTIENTLDKEKPEWYLVADVYDANGGVLAQAKMLSGKQMYVQRDYEIMTRRGENVQDFRMKQMQEKELPIPPKGVVNVELRVVEPPAGVASFIAVFQPFDPVQMLKEQMEEAAKQQQQLQR